MPTPPTPGSLAAFEELYDQYGRQALGLACTFLRLALAPACLAPAPQPA